MGKIEVFKEFIDSLGDEFAKEISWDRLDKYGANFKTFKLVISDGGLVYTFAPTFLMKIFSRFLGIYFYVFLGIFGTIVIGFDYTTNDILSNPIPIIVFIIIFILSILATNFTKKLRIPIVFNKRISTFSKGDFNLENPISFFQLSNINIPLSKLKAFQILPKFIGGRTLSKTYEVNVVFNDKTRIKLFAHPIINDIREDFRILSMNLGVPVWDASYIEI